MLKDEAYGMLTNRTNRRMLRYVNSNLEKYNITTEQWNVLVRVYKEEKLNQKQLSKKTDKDQPTIARIIDILERKKLIERKMSKEDRRAFVINITEEGENLAKEVEPFLEGIFEQVLNGISVEELDTYTKVLMKINENIINIKGDR
ncbi:MAG: MarR family transcriptional regulator [Clostridium sp.]|nr:MarR family transcriptional regulator [Clostridium sp.]